MLRIFKHTMQIVRENFTIVRVMSDHYFFHKLLPLLSLMNHLNSKNMRKILPIISLLVIALFQMSAKKVNPVDFTLQSATDTSKFVLSQHKGKYVVLHFLIAKDDMHCTLQTGEYAFKCDQLPNVVQVFIKPNNKDAISKWVNNVPDMVLKKFQIYMDPDATLAKKFSVKSGLVFNGESMPYPTTIVLDGSGKEVYRYTGATNFDRLSFDKLAEKINELKAAAGLVSN